jgi:hypothetical protein
MEKRVFGILLSLLGIAGLVIAGYFFMKVNGGTKNIKEIVLFGLLGAIFFYSGVSLVRNTKDKAT